jgi:hypothetical protein
LVVNQEALSGPALFGFEFVQEGIMVRPEGFEPPTLWFVAKCSIQLSYGRTLRGTQPSKDIGIFGSEQHARPTP